MIDKTNEPIYRQKDGNYTINVNGSLYGVCDNNPAEKYTKDMVEAYLSGHPEALVEEPVLPPPLPAELLRAEESALRARCDELDRRSIRAMRAIRLGSGTAGDVTRLEDYEAEILAARDRIAEIQAALT